MTRHANTMCSRFLRIALRRATAAQRRTATAHFMVLLCWLLVATVVDPRQMQEAHTRSKARTEQGCATVRIIEALRQKTLAVAQPFFRRAFASNSVTAQHASLAPHALAGATPRPCGDRCRVASHRTGADDAHGIASCIGCAVLQLVAAHCEGAHRRRPDTPKRSAHARRKRAVHPPEI